MRTKATSLANAVHSVLFAGAAVGLSGVANDAMAQSDQDARELDRVQVTGSRINRTEMEGPSPVQVIDREAIDRTGYTRVGELLQSLTASGSAINTALNAPDSGGDGSVRVSLRNLGPERTLVLVNGRRWINGTTQAGVSSSADLSTIPLGIVERVEVLKGGASSVYGSDAIAGVINIILRDDFSGMNLSLQTGQWDDGDGEENAVNFTVGRNDDRGNLVMNFNYTDQKSIMAADRKITRVPQWGADVFGGAISRGSSFTPQGRFIFEDPNTGDVRDITLPVGSSGTPSDSDFRPFDPTQDRFNFAPDNFLQIPLEQRSLYVRGTHDIRENVTFYAEAVYNNRQSFQLQAPVPIGLGSAGILPLDVGVSASNPYNPFGFDLDPTDNLTLIGRRFVEAGTRDYFSDVDTFRLATGVQGDFMLGQRYFDWDVSYIYSKSSRTQRTENLVNHDRLARALGPISDCTGECVPFNIFGGQAGTGNAPGSGGSITQDMVDYVTYTAVDKNEQELNSILANISGDITQLPAGPLSFATGYEGRREFAADTPDSLSAAGSGAASVSGGQRAPTEGRINMDALYAELNIPLVSAMPGIELLEVNISARNSDFDTFGSETTSRFSALWRPTPDLLLRGTFAEGFRAPGVQDLFGGQGVADQELEDPCSDFLNSGVPQEVIDNCIDQGVPADGSFSQINSQIRLTTGGNPNLDAETSESTAFGFVYSPEWASGLDISMDYYEITIEDSITTIGAQSILDACAFSDRLCNLVDRGPNGSVTSLLDTFVNIGSTETSGVDMSIGYRLPETGIGQFDANLQVSWVDSYEESVPDFSDPNAPPETRELVGTLISGQPDRSFPELKARMDLGWNIGNWETVWTMDFVDGYTEPCSDGLTPPLTAFGLCSNPDPNNPTNELGSVTYHDVQVSYDFPGSGIRVTGGINNLFDKTPPVSTAASANSFDATQHRIPGMFGYLRLNASF